MSAWYFLIVFTDGTTARVDDIPLCSRCGHTPCPNCKTWCDDIACIDPDDDDAEPSACLSEGCILPVSDWPDRLHKATAGKGVRRISACVDKDKLS